MARFSVDPAFYARIRGEQDRLKIQLSSPVIETKSCPYCNHKTIRIVKGSKGYVFTKCRKCNEEVLLAFRKAAKTRNYL